MPSPDLSRRAVVTGLGAITPIGNDHPTFWRNLVAGVSGAGPITSLRRDGLRRAYRGRGQGLRSDGRHGPQDGAPHEPLHPPRDGGRQGGRRRRRPRFQRLAPGASGPGGRCVNTGGGGLEQVIDGAEMLRAKGPDFVSPFAIPAVSDRWPPASSRWSTA